MEEKRFTLRLDGELFENIKAIAKKHKRSIGREIEFILETYLSQTDDSDENASEK